MKIVQRYKAISLNLDRYFTGKHCKRGHFSERRTSSGNCLVCHVDSKATWTRANQEKVNASRVKWKAAHPEKASAWNKENLGKLREYRAKWFKSNPIKVAAHSQVRKAILDGKLQKPYRCEMCNQSHKKLHGHHDDYAYPLSVRWLCRKCHNAWHHINGKGEE